MKLANRADRTKKFNGKTYILAVDRATKAQAVRVAKAHRVILGYRVRTVKYKAGYAVYVLRR